MLVQWCSWRGTGPQPQSSTNVDSSTRADSSEWSDVFYQRIVFINGRLKDDTARKPPSAAALHGRLCRLTGRSGRVPGACAGDHHPEGAQEGRHSNLPDKSFGSVLGKSEIRRFSSLSLLVTQKLPV